jgi:acyl-CoA thioester hydrolase
LPGWQNQALMTSAPPPTRSTPPFERPQPELRSAYRVFHPITTRWADNDAYGHVNNVVYYGWFDTAVNALLIERGVIDIHTGPVIGLVVQSQCHYFSPLAFPQKVTAGLRVADLGTSSVRYEIALFADDDEGARLLACAAKGHLTHVYVDRQTRRPTPLPNDLLHLLETLT